MLQNYGSYSTFIWQQNMDTEKERLEQNSSGRDEIFKNSLKMHEIRSDKKRRYKK
jgi:hypothetical protein